MKGKRKAGEKKREKINKGNNYDKICYLRGENRYIFPQSVQYLLGRKNIISVEYDFGGNIYTHIQNKHCISSEY